MYWLIWIVLMLAIPIAAGIWTFAGLRTPQPLVADDRDSALAVEEA